MKRFHFRLARVLRAREIEEEIAREAWARSVARANAAAEDEEAARRALDGAHRELLELEQSAPGRPLSPTAILVGHRALDRLRREIAEKAELALTARSQAATMETAWHDRSAQRKGLSELEARARDRHRKEARREEDAERDENALREHGRRLAREKIDLTSSRSEGTAEEGRSGPRTP